MSHTTLLRFAFCLLVACGSSHGGDAGVGDALSADAQRDSAADVTEDARVDGGDASPPLDANPRDAGTDAFDAGPPYVSCAGTLSAEGEDCCLTTGVCFDPAAPGGCETPTTRGRCASNSDCDADKMCWAPHCLGEGECRDRPEECVPDPSSLCGCDGTVFPSLCELLRAGVRLGGPTACGEPPPGGVRPYCGRDEHCGAESTCCFATGQCTPPDCPECCGIPPEGSSSSCRTDAHCRLDPHYYCDSPIGMCGGVGSCRSDAVTCGGEFMPVCGCDGVTYSNLCWARKAQVQVASTGACDAE